MAIGERHKPRPHDQSGYIRIDSVRQGDLDKQKGVYHINVVDEITQFEVVYSVEKISERFLLPILKQTLNAFSFEIKGFNSDNSSEYINKIVAKLLEKNPRYENIMTPNVKFKSLPDTGKYLKPEVSFEKLDEFATRVSDNEAA